MISRNRPVSLRWGAALLVPVVALAACGDDKKSETPVVPTTRVTVIEVSSSPERQVMSEIYAIGLERAGYRVARIDGVADAGAAYTTVLNGEADVVPGFTDELLKLVRDEAKNTAPVPNAVSDQVTQLTAELPSALALGTPSPAEHKPGVACTDAIIAEQSLTNLSSFADKSSVTIGLLADSAGPVTAAALNETYATTFTTKDLADSETARTAVNDKSVQCLALDSSNPLINELQLKVIVDDKALVPGHAIIPLVAAGVAPDVRAAIDGVSARLNTTNFGQLLNALASGTSPHVAARAFLDTTSEPTPEAPPVEPQVTGVPVPVDGSVVTESSVATESSVVTGSSVVTESSVSSSGATGGASTTGP